MSLLPQLSRLARHCNCSWLRPQLAGQAAALRSSAAATTAGGRAALPATARQSGGSSSSSASSSSTSDSTQPACRCRSTGSRAPLGLPIQQRRAVAAAAGRRGNVFLDDDTAGQQQGRQRGGRQDDGEPTAASLFDSSRFNYDSDEEEEEEEEQQQQQQQQGTAASAAPAAASQQQRRRQQQAAAAAAAGAAVGDAAAPAAAAAAEEATAAVEIVLPPARGVRVKSAEFVKSSVNVEQCPPARYPEFAVIGRSNVGKSSLINMLTGRNSLAMVSKTPGKTRCINHFIINGSWYLVDLPGYGYARTAKSNVVDWNRFTREYFLERETLVTVLLLVDASIPPMALDVACAAWFAEAQIPFTVVFTKLDKRKKGGTPAEENIQAFEQEVVDACGYLPPTILTSSKSGKGRNELLSHIAQLREFYNKTHHGM